MRFFQWMMAAALLIAALTGCTDPEAQARRDQTLVYGFEHPFKTFDTARLIYQQENVILAQVAEPLVRYGPDLLLEPCLAVSWNTPDACSSWVFKLREGVKFHDGTPFNAEAVKINFDRIRDPKVAATRAKRLDKVKLVEVLDEFTIAFRLTEPNCVFPEIINEGFASILSPASIARDAANTEKDPAKALATAPVGTGPFIVEDWEREVAIRFRRNPDYWRPDVIKFEYLEMRPISEATTRFILLEQGALDIADVHFAHVKVARAASDIEVQSTAHLSIRYIGMNTQQPPFNDVRVRQACNYAINKEELVKHVLFGVGEPSRGPIPPVSPSFNPDVKPYPYDPEKAIALLTEAGYPNGIDITMWAQKTGPFSKVADAVVEYLRKVNIRVNLVQYETGVYWDKFDAYLTRDGKWFPNKAGVYDMFIGTWTGGEAGHGFLDSLFTPKSYSNCSFFDNPEVSALLTKYKGVTEPENREPIYKEIQRIVVDEAPWIFAYHGQLNIGVRHRVQGFKLNPAQRLFFEGVTVLPMSAKE